MATDQQDNFDPYAGLDLDGEANTTPETDTAESADVVADGNVTEAPSRSRVTPQRSPASPVSEPEVINADDELDDNESYEAALSDEYHDYSQRPTRFAAPRVEDVLVDDGPSTREQRRAEKRSAKADEKLVKKQAREDEKRKRKEARSQAQAEKLEARAEREAKKREAKKQRNESKPAKPASTDAGGSEGEKKSRKQGIAVAAGVGLLAVAGIGGFLALKNGSDADQSVAQEQSRPAATSSAASGAAASDTPVDFKTVAADECKAAGGTADNAKPTSAEGAIKAFNYAYYVDKDAREAVKFLDKAMYDSVESLQSGIDDSGNGDAHCLKIEPKGGDKFAVTLIEYMESADGDKPESRESKQTITTVKDGDAYKIKQISVG